jgi:hypothetical protein
MDAGLIAAYQEQRDALLAGVRSAARMVRNASAETMLLTPNPASSYINVRLNPSFVGFSGNQISITDAQGKVVYDMNLSGAANVFGISINDLATGIYYVLLKSNGQVISNLQLVKK